MSTRALFLALVANLLVGGWAQSGDDRVAYACLNSSDNKLYLSIYKCGDNQVAQGHATNSINQTGWAYLEVETESKHSDVLQAYAAGLVEGATTRDLIQWHLFNTVVGYCTGVKAYCQRLHAYLQKNLDWMKFEIKNSPNDPYWHQVELVLVQLAGLSDGYSQGPKEPHMNIEPFRLLMAQLSGDLEDLEQALNKPKSKRRRVKGSGSCSALIKPTPGNKDLYFAHDSWSTYQSMLRILKLYKLNYRLTVAETQSPIPGNTVTFSSYPATLPSMDDFYLSSAGLAVTETTIGNNNKTLLKYVRPVGSVLTWIRSQVATRLSRSGSEWVETFKKRNSGTYNNQWMVVDYKKFKSGKDLPKSGLFYVLEQLPYNTGYIKWADMSQFLQKQGYWPSYNVPYFPQIFNLSGGWENVKKYGDWFTYSKTPRALIFGREWRSVVDMPSLQKLMRYNNFRHDPLSRCNCTPPFSAENAISARNDLNVANGTYPFASLGHRSHGGIDMKATNSVLFKRLQFVAIGGPTFDDLEPFRWSQCDFADTTPHVAHPDLWRFEPIIREWKTQFTVHN